MKHPKNQRELLEILVEQEKQIANQSEQIRTLKRALLRLEQAVNKVNVVANRVQGTQRVLSDRVKITESKLRRTQQE